MISEQYIQMSQFKNVYQSINQAQHSIQNDQINLVFMTLLVSSSAQRFRTSPTDPSAMPHKNAVRRPKEVLHCLKLCHAFAKSISLKSMQSLCYQVRAFAHTCGPTQF